MDLQGVESQVEYLRVSRRSRFQETKVTKDLLQEGLMGRVKCSKGGTRRVKNCDLDTQNK